MDRLFVAIYARLLAAMIASVLAIYVVVVPRVDRRVTENFATALSPTLSLVAGLVDRELRRVPGTPPGESTILADVGERFHVPCRVVRHDSLSLTEPQRASLDRGEIVVQGFMPDIVLLVRVGQSEHVLRWGSFSPPNPIGGERGLLLTLLLLVGLFGGAYLLLLPIQRRLKALGAVAGELGKGHLEVRATDERNDAIGRLGATINRMAVQLERLIAGQEDVLRTVSHELRTPLQRAHFALEVVESRSDDPAHLEATARVERSLDELDALIEELLVYLRMKGAEPTLEPLEVTSLLDELCSAMRVDAPGIDLELRDPPGFVEAELDPRLFRRALTNLLGNALEHAEGKAQVTLTASGAQLSIAVEDDGPGVPPEERELIFEPFRTIPRARRRGRGHGLGLSIVRRVADVHGGSIDVDASLLGGARFVLRLPLHRGGPEAAADA